MTTDEGTSTMTYREMRVHPGSDHFREHVILDLGHPAFDGQGFAGVEFDVFCGPVSALHRGEDIAEATALLPTLLLGAVFVAVCGKLLEGAAQLVNVLSLKILEQ
jgi:hypothetical protein